MNYTREELQAINDSLRAKLLASQQENERLREAIALWEDCASKTMQMYGGVIRPPYVKALRQAAEQFVAECATHNRFGGDA